MSNDCNNCQKPNSNDDTIAVMPIAQHEKDQNRLMEIIKWLVAVIALLIVLLVGSNVGWLIYESSFEDIVITQENDDGYNNFIGNDGDITN